MSSFISENEKNNLLEDIKKKAIENYIPILKDDSLDLISLILEIKKPNQILEIGTAVGYSAICFSKYLSEDNPHILTLEVNEDMYKEAKENISKTELNDKIEVINTDATKYLPEMKNENFYDVVFIDAAKGQYLIFLENALRLVKNGGIIIADNVLFKGMVRSDYNEHKHRTAVTRLRKYLEIVNNDKRLSTKVFDIGDGVAISIKK